MATLNSHEVLNDPSLSQRHQIMRWHHQGQDEVGLFLLNHKQKPKRKLSSGDAINAVLAAAGYNFRRLLAWLRLLLLKS